MSDGVRRRRVGLPDAHRRHRRDRAGRPGAGDRGGDPADPRHRAGGAADAPGVRLPDPRPRVRARPTPRRPGSSPTRCGRRSTGGSRGSTSSTSWSASTRADAGMLYIDITLRASAARNDPRNLVFPFYVIPARAARECRSASADATGADVILPAPNLDDRGFQDLVDDAKRLVQQRCPEWTDHNVSDPGVTLIEAFAHMVDQLIYRLNRVPGPALRQVPRADRRRSCSRRPPRAARSRSGCPPPQPATVAGPRRRPRWPRRAPRSTSPSSSPPIARPADRALRVRQPRRRGRRPTAAVDRPHRGCRGGRRRRRLLEPPGGRATRCWSGCPHAVPSCAVLLRIDCPVGGVGIDPRDPPLVWEAWTGSGLERLRGRPRRHRRLQQGRRRRPARARRRTSRRSSRGSAPAGCAAGCCPRTA